MKNKDSYNWLDTIIDEATEALGKRDDVVTFDEVLINVPKLKQQILQAIRDKAPKEKPLSEHGHISELGEGYNQALKDVLEALGIEEEK